MNKVKVFRNGFVVDGLVSQIPRYALNDDGAGRVMGG
jgi:hypothetical protein